MYLKSGSHMLLSPNWHPCELKKCCVTLVWLDLGPRSAGLDLTKAGELRQMEVKTRHCCLS